MAFKMKGYSPFTKSPLKQVPLGYSGSTQQKLNRQAMSEAGDKQFQQMEIEKAKHKAYLEAKKKKGYSAFTKTDPPKKKETSLERAKRGLGLTKEQLIEERRKQREALKKYEEKYG